LELKEADFGLNLLFEPKKKILSQSGNRKKPILLSKHKKFNNMELDMDRFLARKNQATQNAEFKRQSIMVTLSKLLLKGFYETVRTMRFSLFGFQQIQTDALFLFEAVGEVLADEDA
jgi:hypothetical protein